MYAFHWLFVVIFFFVLKIHARTLIGLLFVVLKSTVNTIRNQLENYTDGINRYRCIEKNYFLTMNNMEIRADGGGEYRVNHNHHHNNGKMLKCPHSCK